jgi:hypothetical protein
MTAGETPIERIVAQFGGTSALARQVGRGCSTVSDWCTKGMPPANRIEDII